MTMIVLSVVAGGAYATLGGAPKNAGANDIELQRGLIGYWPMNGNAKDATPNAVNGTVTGAVLTTDRKASASSAYSFNGTASNYISTTGQFSVPTNAVSVSAWIYLNNVTTNQMIVVKEPANTQWEIMTENGNLRWVAGAYNGTMSCTAAVTANAWHHVVGTQTGTTSVLYLDGNVCKTGTQTAITNGTGALDFGRYTSGYNLNGKIDDIRIYNRAISSAEVTALYNQYDPSIRADAGANGLVGQWKLDGNARDSSPYANDGTLVNAPSVTSDRKNTASSAYTFNGTSQYMQVPYNAVTRPTAAITESVWIKPSSIGGTNYQKIISTTEAGGYNLYLVGSVADAACSANTLCAVIYIGGTVNPMETPISGLSNGVWAHIVVTYDGTSRKLYLNGTQMVSIPTTGAISYANNNTLCLGAEPGAATCNGASYFAGSIDDARIYNRGLSAAEVSAQYGSYNSQVQISNLQSGLVGDWPLNGNAKDFTPQSNNGTITGAVLSTDRKGRANSGYSFNGTGSDAIDMGNPDILNITNQITMSAWVNGTVASTGGNLKGVACKDAGGAITNPPYCLSVQDGNSQLIITNTSNAAGGGTTAACGTLQDNTWYLITGTYDSSLPSSSMRMYLNGQFCNSSSSITGQIGVSTGSFRIGRQKTAFASTRSFAGSIDDVRVWNRVLTAAEISRLYATYR